MPDRRSLLRRCGALAALGVAGCAGRSTGGSRSGGSSSGPRSFGTRAAGVTPTDARVQSSVRRLQNVDHNAVDAGPRWYLFVTLDRDDGSPDPTAFSLHTAAGEYESLAARDEGQRRDQIAVVNGQPDDETSGWVLFAVPYDDPAREVRLVRGETRWRLPTAAVDRLRADPPVVDVREVEAPAEPPADEPFDVRLDVANDGGAGTLRAAFNYTAPLYYPQGITASLAAGERRSLSVTVEIHTEGPSEAGDRVAAWVASPDGDDHEWSVTLA